MRKLLRHRFFVLSLFLVLLGLSGAVNKLIHGEHALGTTDVVPWGMLIAGYVFFAAAGTGVGLISSASTVLGVSAMAPLSIRGLFLALALLLPGFALIGIELGNPFHMVYIIFSPNFSSGIWWMGTLYSLYMALLAVECYLSQKPGYGHSRLLSAVAYVTKLAAVANLGAIFALLPARSFWHGSYFPVYMIVTAVLSGAAAVGILLWLLDRRQVVGEDYKNLFFLTGRILLVALIVTAIMTGSKLYASLYSSVYGTKEVAVAYLSGPLSFRFWGLEIAMGMIVPLLLLALHKGNVNRIFAASLLSLVGMFAARADFVAAGFIMPLKAVPDAAWQYHRYTATMTEWVLIAGALGACLLLYGVAEQKLKLDHSKVAVLEQAPGKTKGAGI